MKFTNIATWPTDITNTTSWKAIGSLEVTVSRSNHQRCSLRKAVLERFTAFTGKQLYWSLFLIKFNFIKKRLQHRCFPVNIAKILKTPILKSICERLLLRNLRNKFVLPWVKDYTLNKLCRIGWILQTTKPLLSTWLNFAFVKNNPILRSNKVAWLINSNTHKLCMD